jgi:hypothetical protein
VWKLLNEGAVVFVCGDVAVGMTIRDALVKVAQEHGKYGAFKANVCKARREREGRGGVGRSFARRIERSDRGVKVAQAHGVLKANEGGGKGKREAKGEEGDRRYF